MSTPISIVGAPTDIGAGSRGASMGPEALRVANIGPMLEGLGLEVVDRGNLVGPANPWRPPEGGYRHLAEVAVDLIESLFGKSTLMRVQMPR